MPELWRSVSVHAKTKSRRAQRQAVSEPSRDFVSRMEKGWKKEDAGRCNQLNGLLHEWNRNLLQSQHMRALLHHELWLGHLPRRLLRVGEGRPGRPASQED